jgi:hypothetical protein
MNLKAEDFEDQGRFRLLQKLNYGDIVNFVFEYLKRNTGVTFFFWSFCLLTFSLAVVMRINLSAWYETRQIFLHTLIGLFALPLLVVPAHELLHIIPYFFMGARRIRVGVDFRQFIFYVTAHRHVATATQFRIVALFPFVLITITNVILLLTLPGLWKWSITVFLFVHSTMCAGDFAMLNFFHLNRHRKIYTWDDADAKEAYFYEEI